MIREEVFEWLDENCLEAVEEHYGFPPEDYVHHMYTLHQAGESPILTAFRGEWVLLRQPSIRQIRTYFAGCAYQHEKDVAITNMMRVEAVKWLLRACVVLPDDFIEKMHLGPFTQTGVINLLLSKLRWTHDEIAVEMEKVFNKPLSLLESHMRTAEAYGFLDDLEEYPVPQLLEKFRRARDMIERKHMINKGNELQILPRPRTAHQDHEHRAQDDAPSAKTRPGAKIVSDDVYEEHKKRLLAELQVGKQPLKGLDSAAQFSPEAFGLKVRS